MPTAQETVDGGIVAEEAPRPIKVKLKAGLNHT